MTLHHALHYIAFTLMLVATRCDAIIDSDSILAFLCIASLQLITKKSLKLLIRNLCVSQIGAMQGLVSHCEPALTLMFDDVPLYSHMCIHTYTSSTVSQHFDAKTKSYTR